MRFKSIKAIHKVLSISILIIITTGIIFIFSSSISAAVNTNPTWYVDARVINHGQAVPYDYYAAKDPTIVYSGGKYHVFYTGANQSGGWQMLYTSASTIDGLKTAPRTYMNKIGEAYFCAPQVFYFEPQGLWYLIYQDGTYGAAYSTTTDVADPNSWSGPKKLNISGNTGLDYYVICDDNYAYLYNSPNDRNIYVRKTSLANFPNGWGSPSVAISDTWEGHTVYKSKADGKYYLLAEDYKDGRYYELWTSSSAGGPWTQLAEKWAWSGNLSYTSDKWTTNVSHGELIRAGVNQKFEINDINRVDFLIQGTTNTSGTYQQIIWDLGIIRNYSGQTSTTSQIKTTPPQTTAPPTATVTTTSTTSTQTSTPTNTTSTASLSYTQNDWGNGATVSVTINNNSTSAINGWKLQWTFPGTQKITNMWGATYVQNGATMTVENTSYNATIPANGLISFGFNITYSDTNTKPTAFTLNGNNCTVQ